MILAALFLVHNLPTRKASSWQGMIYTFLINIFIFFILIICLFECTLYNLLFGVFGEYVSVLKEHNMHMAWLLNHKHTMSLWVPWPIVILYIPDCFKTYHNLLVLFMFLIIVFVASFCIFVHCLNYIRWY
jgi:hypothetical protein